MVIGGIVPLWCKIQGCGPLYVVLQMDSLGKVFVRYGAAFRFLAQTFPLFLFTFPFVFVSFLCSGWLLRVIIIGSVRRDQSRTDVEVSVLPPHPVGVITDQP